MNAICLKNFLPRFYIKNLLVICLLTMGIQQQVFSKTYPIVADLNSQTKVNSFGANGYTAITESLTIRGAAITSLSPLSTLNTAGDFFYILDNLMLPNMYGFSALSCVGGNFAIVNNNVLPNLNGLFALSSLGAGLRVVSNAALTTLNGLDNITSITGYLDISSNGFHLGKLNF